MRHLTLPAVLAASLFSGCVVYDNHCPSDEYGHGDHDYDGDYDGDDEAPEATYTLTPDTIAPGEVIISSMISDMALDYESIVEVEFTSEDVRVCTTTARDDELLITIGSTDYAAEGLVDMVIVFENGETAYVEGALEVTFGDDEPGDPNGGDNGDGGGNDGGSDGGGDNGGNDGGSDGGNDGGNSGSDGSNDDADSICG